MKVSDNFYSSEFDCKCKDLVCTSKNREVPTALLLVLEDVRVHFNAVVEITSGFRCKWHNEFVGGSPMSKHKLHIAADIQVDGVDAHKVFRYLEARNYANLLGLGEYESFTHVDVRGEKARW